MCVHELFFFLFCFNQDPDEFHTLGFVYEFLKSILIYNFFLNYFLKFYVKATGLFMLYKHFI